MPPVLLPVEKRASRKPMLPSPFPPPFTVLRIRETVELPGLSKLLFFRYPPGEEEEAPHCA